MSTPAPAIRSAVLLLDLAPGVDGMLRAQIERYQRYVNAGKP
jgi:hypothetical protein